MSACPRRTRLVVACCLAGLLTAPAGATADITAFLSTSVAPGGQFGRGLAGGTGLVAIGFEVEVAHMVEGLDSGDPALTTGTANLLVQTPLEVSRTQFYATTGLGLYRERLQSRQETSALVCAGGGAKIRVTGPLKLRIDYRLFRLRGSPVRQTAHRLYAGATLGF